MKSVKVKAKQLFLCLLISLSVIFGLAGCGSGDNDNSATNSEVSSGADEASNEISSEEETGATEASLDDSISLEDFDQVIYDADGVKFEITGINPDDMWGYSVKIYLENNTDKTLMYSIDDAAINGIMSDPFWASEVQPGKKSNESFEFSNSDLKEAGINEVTNIEFQLNIHDSEDYSAEYIVEDIFTIYPLGEEKSTITERAPSDNDVILFDTEDCRMTVIGYDPDDIFGYTVKVYLENKTNSKLMFAIEDASINGFMADPFWASTVAAGKCSYNDISWSTSIFDENKIDEVESIEMIIHVRNDDDWSSEYLVDGTYTIEP